MSERPKAVKPRRLPLRWRRVALRIGMLRETRYELRRGGEVRARVALRHGCTEDSWYWYGCGRNTAHAPQPLAKCKAEAKAAALKWEAEHG